MVFSEKIQQLRSKAQETQAANKIIDMLTQLELTNDTSTSYRWVWELIQNAKDVVNSSGMVDIVINFDSTRKTVEFKHNGKLFSTENIVFLIEQVSTKDRTITDETTRTTGKFGTGFLTTHLLSKKVTVSGYLKDEEDSPCSFSVVLDRSGKEKQSIIKAIQQSCSQLDENTTVVNSTAINEEEFNTRFIYALDESGVDIAKKGLKNLLVSAPYVFAFVSEINSITVTSGQFIQKISRGSANNSNLENAHEIEVVVETKRNGIATNENKYVYVNGTKDLSLAFEIQKKENVNIIMQYNKELPRIFCDFPLLGTSDFPFPVIINSPLFNPTEPRNGIHLTNKEHEQITQNKKILKESYRIYIEMLNYLSEENYEGIYNIVKIPKTPEKDWLSQEWFEQNIINVLKSYIKTLPLIYTHSAVKKSLFDESGNTCVLIPKDQDEVVRKKVWNLSSNLFPNMITKYDELEFWYDSLWDECHNFGIFDLIEKVEKFETIDELSKNINGDVYDWLNELLGLFYSKEESFVNNYGRTPYILPNQHGIFCTTDTTLLDSGIDEAYKNIAIILDFDLKNRLLDRRINSCFFSDLGSFTLEEVFAEFAKRLHKPHPKQDEFLKEIICLQGKQNEEQNDFINLVITLYGEDAWRKNAVSRNSNEILKTALKFWREKISKEINICENTLTFTSQFNFANEHTAIIWLSNYVDVLVKYEQDTLLDTFKILPNQYGTFKKSAELSLDSGQIDAVLKEACIYAGYDVRATLLSEEIHLDLPKSRTIYLEDISGKITKYVKENKNNLGQQNAVEKEIFNKTYFWLRENSSNETVKNCFKDLFLNLHWFYNDNDIAENMSKVEEYNDLLNRYGVTGVQELETILSQSSTESKSTEIAKISQELLAQWGISNEDDLNRALANNLLNADFLHDSESSLEMFNYVQTIIERSKNKIIDFLNKKPEYDVSNPIPITNTIFIIKKHDSEIYLITRPSDYGQVILYYSSELDVLDYEKDCELWVEDKANGPQKITFGKMLKLTGVNKIPLRSIKESG
ncbi:ATP-binding protein [Paenibacillus barcinonensis]|uniref:ATP-binding protein n=1 Tax=Paenibacillus barcinonensis TaxID=198119 RepID=A0A2V4VBL2_PAEBA|nr:ATP-binding protein [Paenibacillus barcinonensis]PYE49777.1 hypothetical protein DFQ00_105281 [Paenibacillus barcinonensis]QKS56534.1 ATP-binding protein [Paenibacillus barcinonensis]